MAALPQTPAPQPLFEQSSQFRNWRFSKNSLNTMRQELNQGAVARVRAKIEEERSTSPAKSNPAVADAPAEPAPNEVTYLTVEDEQNLVKFYLNKIPQLAKAFQFPEAVASTAMSYLKRFYLRNTCMDYHPKTIMLTCLFLATKTEVHYISINAFAAKIKSTSPSDILSLEFLVSQSLKFQYKVHHAGLAAYGVFLDMQNVAQDTPIAKLEQVYTQGAGLISTSRLSDLEFFYTPSQIALAGFYAVDPGLVETWLLAKHPSVTNDHTVEHQEVLDLLKVIAQQMKEVKEPKTEDVRQVDKRLKFCHNPEKDPNSALYKKRQAEQEHADHERRLKKSKELDDPFASSALPANGAKNQPRPLSPAVKLGSGATPSASADPFK